MADDKKKQTPGDSTQQSSGTAVNSAPEPTWDINAYDHPTEDTAEGKTAEPQPEHPVKSWWDRITGTAKELPRSVARGVVNAANETAQTIYDGAAAVDRVSGLGEALTPGFNKAYD